MNGSNEAAPAADEHARSDFKLEAGKRIAKLLWDGRAAGVAERVARAERWARASSVVARDKAGPGPLEVLSTLGCATSPTGVVEGILERAARDVRTLLVHLDPANAYRGFAPKPADTFETLLELDRSLDVAATCARAERDATILALHATANGHAPWLAIDPDAFDVATSPFAIAGAELGCDPFAIEDAESLCRTLRRGAGGDLSRAEVETFLRFAERFRVRPTTTLEPADDAGRSARFPSLLAVLAAHPGRWEPEAVNAAESYAAKRDDDRPASWWESQLDRFDAAAKSARAEEPNAAGAAPRGSDDDEGPGGPPTPPSSASPASPAAPPASPQGSATMPPPTLGSPPWRGAAPVPRPRRGVPHLRLVTARPEPEVELVRVAAGGAR